MGTPSAEGARIEAQRGRSSATGAEVERRRREDRGAEGAEKGMVWGGGVPFPDSPLPRKFFDFGSQYGEFWCILDGIFLQFSYLFYTQNRSSTAICI